MENTSGIIPVGHRILILPEQVQEKTESGIILHTESQREREGMAQMYGLVVYVGDDAYNDQSSHWCGVGDRVSFAKYSGLVYEGIDGKIYRCINDLDIVALVKEGVR